MLSRRAIFWMSVGITLALYAVLLWLAPQITLLKANRLAERINTRFRVEFLDTTPERVETARAARGDSISSRNVEALFSSDPGTLPVQDSLANPPVDTPNLEGRLAGETLERAYDLAPEQERSQRMDTRILEIAADDARRDISVPRRLVRPSPEYTLPLDAMPALRSRDMRPEDIALEPARIGTGLLVQAMPMTDAAPPDGAETEKPPFEAAALGADQGETGAPAQLEQMVVSVPVEKETKKAREESAYSFLDDMVDIQLETYIPAQGQTGYFRLRILPRKDATLPTLPRDVIFVVDASRSVQQRKLDLIARGIADALETFRPEDRVNIVLFRDTAATFQPEPAYATPETIAAAKAFLGNLQSHGQTDVYNALFPLAQTTPRPNLPSIILVATDGVPTTGVRDSRTIINAVTSDNALRNSVFAYGAGNTVNRYLLDLLAYRNKGDAMVSGNIQQARTDIAAFMERLAHPVMVNLQAEYGQAVHGDVYPQIVPDFYRERPITLYGRFDPAADNTFAVRITGRADNLNKELIFRAALAEAKQGGKEIAQGWAFEKSYHIIGEISRQGELPELLTELRTLSQQYSIRTIYDE